MYLIGVIKGFGAAPDNSKACIGGGGSGGVGKFHLVTVDSVAEKLGVNASDTTFDVELAHKARLCDELRNVVNLHFDTLQRSRRHQDFLTLNDRNAWTEVRTASYTRPNALHTVDKHIVAAVLSAVVRASVAVDAPVTGEGGGHAAEGLHYADNQSKTD